MECIAGVDIGTTGAKVTIYDEAGKEIDSAYEEYELFYSKTNRTEIDPLIWWDAVCRLFRDIFNRLIVTPENIVGIGVSSTNALVLTNKNGEPVYPAIMQLDRRATHLVEKIKSDIGEELIYETTGNRVTSGAFWGPSLLWFSLEQRDTLKNTEKFFTPHSFINYKLTNNYVIDHSRAVTTMLYDIHEKNWNSQLCSYFGIKMEFLPEIHQSYSEAGKITKESSQLTGLLAGTPVVVGCMDSLAAQIGLGAGDTIPSLILGSVGRICINTNICDPRFMNSKSIDQLRFFSIAPVNASGISYKWIKSILFENETQYTNTLDKNIYQVMDEYASKSPIGSRGMIYQPYIAGERSPIWNPEAVGSFLGLKLEHKKEDFIRAVLEGVGYALAHNLAIFENELHEEINYFHVGGGGATSPIWLQILSNILGKPLKVPVTLESETLGSAILAGVGVGIYSNLQEGIYRTYRLKEQFEPDLQAHEIYTNYLEVYKEAYERNVELYNKLKGLYQYQSV